ncbi:MAG: hypothetical protein I8H86_07315 [Sphingomonadaceae bacterium]|nr:hypothetical protein [Sphingomonadaceae bacterium]MBH1999247.1 hypothetical protein [Sphingomonadaceae bacterium]
MRSSAAFAGLLACLVLNLPARPADASRWYCGAGQWTPPWLPQPAPERHDLSCHLLAGCRREDC